MILAPILLAPPARVVRHDFLVPVTGAGAIAVTRRALMITAGGCICAALTIEYQ